MIKKNTKIVFEEDSRQVIELVGGGIPLFKKDIVQVFEEDSKESIDYIVTDKKVEFTIGDEDQIANITYKLRKK